MAEWGIPFDHIEAHWTDRQFYMMLARLNERNRKSPRGSEGSSKGGRRKISYKAHLKERGLV